MNWIAHRSRRYLLPSDLQNSGRNVYISPVMSTLMLTINKRAQEGDKQVLLMDRLDLNGAAHQTVDVHIVACNPADASQGVQIKWKHSQKYLTVVGGVYKNKVQLVQRQASGGQNQRFLLVQDEPDNESVYLVPVASKHWVMDVPGNATYDNGTSMQLWECNRTDAQRFLVVPARNLLGACAPGPNEQGVWDFCFLVLLLISRGLYKEAGKLINMGLGELTAEMRLEIARMLQEASNDGRYVSLEQMEQDYRSNNIYNMLYKALRISANGKARANAETLCDFINRQVDWTHLNAAPLYMAMALLANANANANTRSRQIDHPRSAARAWRSVVDRLRDVLEEQMLIVTLIGAALGVLYEIETAVFSTTSRQAWSQFLELLRMVLGNMPKPEGVARRGLTVQAVMSVR